MLKTRYLFKNKKEMIDFLISIYQDKDYFNSPLSDYDINYLDNIYENDVYVRYLNQGYLQVGQLRDWIIILSENGNFLIVKKQIWEK